MKCLYWFWLGTLCFITTPWSGAAPERRLLSGHLPRSARQQALAVGLESTNRLNLTIGLPLRNQQELNTLLRELYDPASPNFHHYLSPKTFAENFGPSEADYQLVAKFARSTGFTITSTHEGRMILEASAKAGDVEKAFRVRLRTYPHPTEYRRYFAPDSEPSVQADIPILDISGLDNYLEPSPQANIVPLEDLQKAQAEDWTGSGIHGTFLPSDIRTAYASDVTADGTGQSVGLLEFDGFYAADIHYYEKLAGLRRTTLREVALPGFSGPGKNNGEVSLDVEMAIAMAPGLSSIIVYEAPQIGSFSGQFNSLLLRMAEDDAAAQLSSSWNPPSGPSLTRDQIFQQMAAQGQTFFQASGDDGAYTNGVHQRADNPYVTIVGGTSLQLWDWWGLNYSESVWNEGTSNRVSGGGISTSYLTPSWQRTIDMSGNGGSTNYRNSPDVAMLADGIYVTYNNGTQGAAGGTSAAAPLWAGFMALVNQQAAENGLPNVGFLNPAIYAIGQGANYPACFHDITSGANTTAASPNQFYATTGYDLCTGWGTPVGQSLIDVLTTGRATLVITPGNGFAATGMERGPFTNSEEIFSLANAGWMPVQWAVGNVPAWLSVSIRRETLPPNQAAIEVTISLNYTATRLGPGHYSANLNFTNVTEGTLQSFPLTLQIWQLGSLQVSLSPETAVQAGAQWRVDGGPWQSSGVTLSGITTGDHTVDFLPVANWDTPSIQTVSISGLETNSVTGVYNQQAGSLTVTLLPTDVVAGGAHWQVDGGTWMNSGDTAMGLLATNHTITFSTMPGWVTPPEQSISIGGNLLITTSGIYNELYHFTTIAGLPGNVGSQDGTPALFSSPQGIAVDVKGNVFVADTGNNTIRMLTQQGTNWTVTTVAGLAGYTGSVDGDNEAAQFNTPLSLATDAAGNVYVSDNGNNTIRCLTLSGTNWTVSSIAGLAGNQWLADGTGSAARFESPGGIAIDGSGNLWEADLTIHEALRYIERDYIGWTVSTFRALYNTVSFSSPYGLAIIPGAGTFVAEAGANDIATMRDVWTPYYGVQHTKTVVCGSGAAGSTDGSATEAQFFSPKGIAGDLAGNLYVADTGNHTIRKLLPISVAASSFPTYNTMTIGGVPLSPGSEDGIAKAAHFNFPSALTVDTNGNLFIADTGNHTIRMGSSLLRSVQIEANPSNSDIQAAHFQVDGGAWIAVGSMLRLPPGDHSVAFENVPGWLTPTNQTITLGSNQVVTGFYVAQLGELQLTLGPSNAVAAGAQWQLDGGAWQKSGATLTSQFGPHQLAFMNIAGWEAPTNQNVVISATTNALFLAYTAVDSNNPSLFITSPKPEQKWTNQTLTLSGSATDNVGVVSVYYQLNGGDWIQATGTTQWQSTSIALAPGTVTAKAYAIDKGGNYSKTNTVHFSNAPTAPLTITVSGNGTISPNLNGQSLVIGRSYALTAKPAKGSIFSYWAGDLSSPSPAIKFTVQTNTVVQANFVPCPFLPIAGTYNGLFYSTNGVTQPSSGFFSAQLSGDGTFSGNLRIEGSTYGFSSHFSALGTSSNYISRSFNPIALQLQLDLANGTGMTGELITPDWKAHLTAQRCPFSKTLPAPEQGKYTLRIPAGKFPYYLPGGDGVGAATVDALGNVKFTGTLGDGSVVSQTAMLSQEGQWPLYINLYSGHGAILGWLAFTNTPTLDLVGDLTWMKWPQVSTLVYPYGFSLQRKVEGSAYHFTKDQPLLDFNQGQIRLAGGNLSASFTNLVSFGGKNVVTNLSSNAASLSIATNSGLFQGKIVNPATRKSISFSGAILQKQNAGYGFFMGTNEVGQIYFGE